MNLLVAKSAGFCFGVKRAIDMINEAVEEKSTKKIYTLGPIIHNSQVVDKLEKKGVISISSINDLNDKESALLIIRTHGISEESYNRLKILNIEYIDASCPYVKKIHNIVKDYYSKDYKIIIVGDKNHPEVIGINGWCDNSAIILDTLEMCKKNVEKFKKCDKICIVAQTTFKRENWNEITHFLNNCCTNIFIFDTICSATNNRQQEAMDISKKVDIMYVIGGKHSSNTRKLYEICKLYCENTYFIETKSEINICKSTLDNKKIGITAGASTPNWIIDDVINYFSNFSNVD